MQEVKKMNFKRMDTRVVIDLEAKEAALGRGEERSKQLERDIERLKNDAKRKNQEIENLRGDRRSNDRKLADSKRETSNGEREIQKLNRRVRGLEDDLEAFMEEKEGAKSSGLAASSLNISVLEGNKS